MICAQCSAENRDGSNYCRYCSAPLTQQNRDPKSASELSNTPATAGSFSSVSRATVDLRTMQLNERGQGNRASLGNTCCCHRSSVYVFAHATIPVDQRSKQVPQLRTRV